MVVKSFELKKICKLSKGTKVLNSFVILSGIFALGLTFGVLGPSLLQLSRKYDTDIATVSKYFPILIVCGVIGAVPCGLVCDLLNRQIATGLLQTLIGIGIIALAFAPTLITFFIVSAIIGIIWIGYEASQIAWIIELWGEHAGAMLQGQFFGFSLGTFVGPFMVQFILPDESPASTESESGNQTDTIPASGELAPLLFVPFVISGGVFILAGFLAIILYNIKKYEKVTVEVAQNKNEFEMPVKTEESQQNPTEIKHSRVKKFILIGLSSLGLGLQWGMELSTLQFLPTFAHLIDLRVSERDGATLLSGFALTYTIGRGIGGVIALKVPPKLLLAINYIILITGVLVLIFFSNNSMIALIVGALSIGLGVSTVSAAYIGYFERHVEMGNVESSSLLAGSNITMTAYALVIGSFLEAMPFVYLYAMCAAMCVTTTLFLILNRLMAKNKTK